MKLVFTWMILMWSSLALAYEQSWWQVYSQSSAQQKAGFHFMIRKSLHELNAGDLQLEEPTTVYFSLLQKAWAKIVPDCFYAGWPSSKKNINGKFLCQNPRLTHELYKNGTFNPCKGNELLCSPVLFGEPICIRNVTSQEKQTAYSRCETQFLSQKRDEHSVLKYVTEKGLESHLKEIIELSQGICSVEKNSSPMCKKLSLRVERMKKALANQGNSELTKEPQKEDQKLTPEDVKPITQKLEETSTKIQQTIEAQQKPCPPQENENKVVFFEKKIPREIDQDLKTPENYCAGSESGGKLQHFDKYKDSSDEGAVLRARYTTSKGNDQVTDQNLTGIAVDSDIFGEVKSYVENGEEYADYFEKSVPNRTIEVNFRGRGKEIVLEVVDGPVKEIKNSSGQVVDRYRSTDLKGKTMYFFPRNTLPKYEIFESTYEITIGTGEKIVFDRKTGRPIGGVLSEVASQGHTKSGQTCVEGNRSSCLRFNPNVSPKYFKHQLIYPDKDLKYQGQGIWLEEDGFPENLSHQVVFRSKVNGVESKCSLTASEIFVLNSGFSLPLGHPNRISSGWKCRKLKLEKDEDYYQLIRNKCPQFKFPELTKN